MVARKVERSSKGTRGQQMELANRKAFFRPLACRLTGWLAGLLANYRASYFCLAL